MKDNDLWIGLAILGGIWLFGQDKGSPEGQLSSTGVGVGMGGLQTTTTEAVQDPNKNIVDNTQEIQKKLREANTILAAGAKAGSTTSNPHGYQTVIGNKTYTAFIPSNAKVIPNKTGKNYADLGAGSDPSKW